MPETKGPGTVDRRRPAVRPDLLKRTHVVLLGTGTPNADPDRHGPSLAVVSGGVPYVVDCGPGVVRRAAAAFRAGVRTLKVSGLDTLFLTHLHSDHTAGFPDLIFSPWVLGRKRPLRVFGPEGTVEMTFHILRAYAGDVEVRLKGLEPANDQGHRVTPRDCRPGEVFRDRNVAVHAFTARHGRFRQAFGYRFATPDMDVCVSGDTAPYPEMTANYARCDVLIHEVFSTAGLARRPAKWRAYHTAVHTSSKDVAAVARKARPGVLVLVHHLQWGTGDRELVREVRSGYRGRVVYGRDLTFIGLRPGFRGYRRGGPSPRQFRILDLSGRP